MRDFLSNLVDDEARNPQTAAQEAMRPVLPKRFYKEVSVGPADEGKEDAGFAILLDGRTVRTPGRHILILPTSSAAEIIAQEWQAQDEKIDPAQMPATRLANTARDAIVEDPQAVIEDMLKFASSDLLCYRASTPDDLVALQQEHWDPVLDWAATTLGAHFETTTGLVQIPQPKVSVAALSQTLKQWPDPISIAALHTFTSLTGSILLALAVALEEKSAEQAWTCAHVDENWNASRWGEDYEAKKRMENRKREFQAAAHLFFAIRG